MICSTTSRSTRRLPDAWSGVRLQSHRHAGCRRVFIISIIAALTDDHRTSTLIQRTRSINSLHVLNIATQVTPSTDCVHDAVPPVRRTSTASWTALACYQRSQAGVGLRQRHFAPDDLWAHDNPRSARLSRGKSVLWLEVEQRCLDLTKHHLTANGCGEPVNTVLTTFLPHVQRGTQRRD
jgi:hypothetical protein